jgi:predicted RNase H-like HicB family nuclease
MAWYVGILDGNDDVWGVRIPDCPGALAGGATPDAAISEAVSALAAWSAAMLKDGETLPQPRTLAAILADPDAAPDTVAGETAVMIPLLLDKGRPVKATLSIDAGMLEAIDQEAQRRGLTRSGFLVSAARMAMTETP